MAPLDPQSHRLHLGEFVFDLNTRMLLGRDVQPISLRTKSLRVLGELARRNGETVEKDDLIAAAWAGRSISDDSLVQCIKDIRTALNDRDRQLLRTAVGRGYSLHGVPERQSGHGERPKILISPFRVSEAASEISELSDMIAEDLILALSPRAGFDVVTDEDMGEHALYTIAGRIGLSGETVRVFVQFASRESGKVIFGETWTAPLGDTSPLRRRICEKTASIARIHLFNSAGERHIEKDNDSLNTQELLAKAAYHMSRIQMETRAIARDALIVAVEREPTNAVALAMRVSSALILVLQEGVSKISDPPNYCSELAERAVGIAPHVDFVMLTRGCVRLWLEADHEGARADFARALEVNPVFHLAHQFLAISEILSGDHASGIPRVRKIIDLGTIKNPRYPHYLALLALGQMCAGERDAAFVTAREGHERAPGDPWCGYVYLAAAADRTELLRTDGFRRVVDGMSLPFSHFRSLPFTDPRDVDMLEMRLTAAGFPSGA